ncbi:MAG: ATP-grasp domain-containing protein [Candidatus Saccharimonas sp.]
MNLLEYEAKAILRRFDIPTPRGEVFRLDDALPTAPIVLKSQVHTGGRGKAGGIRVVNDQKDISHEIKKLYSLEIKGELPQSLLTEEVLDIANEYYLAVVINREASTIELIAHREGGIEVESHDSADFWRKELITRQADEIGESLAEYYDLPQQTFVLQELVKRLHDCVVASDATLLEINPLIYTRNGKLVAGDCKMTLDADAGFRHPEWKFESLPENSNFVALDATGTVATIANGAGLAMATVDAVKAAGLKPANFLDIGGGASVESIVASFHKILEFPKISVIIINIFGGIVRCDDVAEAIIAAKAEFPSLPPLYIRLSGNRRAEAAELLQDEGLTLYPDLTACIDGVNHG